MGPHLSGKNLGLSADEMENSYRKVYDQIRHMLAVQLFNRLYSCLIGAEDFRTGSTAF